jgi:hypothetical protein
VGSTWRYTVGSKGISRVTVFERADAQSIFIEWWDERGRHREALRNALGQPVTDRTVAEVAARRAAAAQERRRNSDAAALLGLPSRRTLGELLDRRHADLGPRWSAKYSKSRDLRKAFWLDKLGADLPLVGLSPAVVEKIARDAQGTGEDAKSDRWRQDVLRYLVDSYIYAERKLKWIEPRHNLSAVEIPAAKGTSLPYSLAEAKKLLPELWKVHPVAGWMGTVAVQTGRRIGAIRTLTPDMVSRDGRWTLITFPAGTDKARNTGVAAAYDLPERTDWTVPPYETCHDWLRAAETAAELPHVPGRGYHALKRLYATLTVDLPGADRQSGTRRETLDGHYRQDTLAPKMDVAKRLAEYI